MAGDLRLELVVGRVAGSWRLEAGDWWDWWLETGGWGLVAAGWRLVGLLVGDLVAGSWSLGTGDWRLEIGCWGLALLGLAGPGWGWLRLAEAG